MGDVELTLKAKNVDLAVEAAMQELGVTDRDQISIEVVQEPGKGFLGIGGQDAVIRVKKRRNRRRRSNKGKGQAGSGKERNGKPQSATSRGDYRQRGGSKSARTGEGKNTQQHRKSERKSERKPKTPQKTEKPLSDDRPTVSIEEQANIAKEFLEGLVSAYGLEGEVTATIDDDVVVADVSGEQTEALVGVRGSVRSAIHELTRTVLQRYAQDTARLRLDIAGYGERRRQALSIYAEQLIEQLEAEGGEIMLEPMSPADRKVIHDVASSRDRINSYSEGEPPRRFVVLSIEASNEEE